MPIEVESPEQLGYQNVKYNLAESSVTDFKIKNIQLDLNELVVCYGHHSGKEELRALIVKHYDNVVEVDDVLLTAGAAAGLFIVSTSLLSKDDHLIVVRPNYATNIETPRAIDCEISYVDLQFENKFDLDVEYLSSLIKKNTRLICITAPHNPTGTIIKSGTLAQLISLAEKNNCYLLVDETYRDLTRESKLPFAAGLSDKVISVSSLSKAYGLPGIRMGWVITKNKKLQELFLAAKEQIYICNSVIDEKNAYQFMLNKEKYFLPIKKHMDKNFKIVQDWMKSNEYMEWVEPSGGVVCFPRIKKEINVDIEKFYSILNDKYKTFVGPGHWFEMDKRYMRIGFGWPREEELEKGLSNIMLSIKDVTG